MIIIFEWIKYAYKSGYSPRGMISFLKKLKEMEDNTRYRIEFFSTHPLVENRIERLEVEIEIMNIDN